MMRPTLSLGGVLSSGADVALHEKVRGRAYRTPDEAVDAIAHALSAGAKPVPQQQPRPFTSQQVQKVPHAAVVHAPQPASSAPRAAAQAAQAHIHTRAASHKSAARPSTASSAPHASTSASPASSSSRPASARPHARAATHKKTAASTTSSMTVSHRGAAASLQASRPYEHAVPSWVVSDIHAPNRPNAPSQMSEEERRAAHRAPSRAAAGSATAGGAAPAHKPKSHKLTVHPYPPPPASALPRDEAHASVSIERHAHPIVIRPATKGQQAVVRFVPIGVAVNGGGAHAAYAPQAGQLHGQQVRDQRRPIPAFIEDEEHQQQQRHVPNQHTHAHRNDDVSVSSPWDVPVQHGSSSSRRHTPTQSAAQAHGATAHQVIDTAGAAHAREVVPHHHSSSSAFAHASHAQEAPQRPADGLHAHEHEHKYAPHGRGAEHASLGSSTSVLPPHAPPPLQVASVSAESLATPALGSPAAAEAQPHAHPHAHPHQHQLQEEQKHEHQHHHQQQHQPHEALTSPSPVRGTVPSRSTHSGRGAVASPVAAVPAAEAPRSPVLSPNSRAARALRTSAAQDAEQQRRKLESEWDQKMKAFLSPDTHTYQHKGLISPTGQHKAGASATKQRSGKKKQKVSPSGRAVRTPAKRAAAAADMHFTPNPHAAAADSNHASSDTVQAKHEHTHEASPTTPLRSHRAAGPEEAASVTSSSSQTSPAEPVGSKRPPDLPPVPVVHAAPKLLYPPAETPDPLRSLAAALRGPRLVYDASMGNVVPASAAAADETPLSPGAYAAGAAGAEAAEAAVSAELASVVASRVAAREAMEKQMRAEWAQKWSKVREVTQNSVATVRSLASPTSAAQRAAAEQAAAAAAQAQGGQGAHRATDAAARSLRFDAPVEAVPASAATVHPGSSFHASHAAPATHAAAYGAAYPPSAASSHGGTMQPSHQPTHQPHVAVMGGRSFDPQVVTRSSAPHAPASTLLFSASHHGAPAPLPALPPTRRFAVGSANRAKVQCVREVVARVFAHPESESARLEKQPPLHPESVAAKAVEGLPWRPAEVVSVVVESGVAAQPLSAEETQRGALLRARAALDADPLAEWGVGIEGGAERVGHAAFETGWVAIVDRRGKVGLASSARFQLANPIMRELEAGGVELADIVDRLSGEHDVRSGNGFMGQITNSMLTRGDCYRHGVLFALAPLISHPCYFPED